MNSATIRTTFLAFVWLVLVTRPTKTYNQGPRQIETHEQSYNYESLLQQCLLYGFFCLYIPVTRSRLPSWLHAAAAGREEEGSLGKDAVWNGTGWHHHVLIVLLRSQTLFSIFILICVSVSCTWIIELSPAHPHTHAHTHRDDAKSSRLDSHYSDIKKLEWQRPRSECHHRKVP